MIVLDTNVVSEAMKPEPHPAVLSWLDRQSAETLHLPSIALADLLFGIASLPDGRRKKALTQTLEGLLDLFADSILAFDINAARQYAILAPTAHAAGRGFPVPDGYIAAIAQARNFTVATRDVAPFQAAGLNVINLWQEAR